MGLSSTLSDTLSFGPSRALRAPGTSAGERVLSSFEIWFDATNGTTNQGTDSATLTLAGATDEGDHWELGGAAEGLEVDGYTGELNIGIDGTIGGSETDEAIPRVFIVFDMGTITPGDSSRYVFSNKTAVTDAADGLAMRGFQNNEWAPRFNLGDGSTAATVVHATNCEDAGRVMVWMHLFDLLGTPFVGGNVITSAGSQTGVSTSAGALAEPLAVPSDGMVFGAANDASPPNATDGPNGVTWDVYAFGYDRSQNKVWTQADAEAVAQYYGVL